ncbi:MAG TPA: hypothetical protein ACFCUY_17790 [Xenococcaceae cyanobacterium]
MSILKSKFTTWLLLSIVVSILFSCAGLKLSFQSVYTIQDDARQHIFWMQQFGDRSLFQEDLITNYFKSVSPWGFAVLYKLINSLGIDIFWFNKISPLLIGIITTIYCFLVSLEFLAVPLAGFFSSLLLNQNLWMVDDLASGTPRAFIYPLFLAFIYYLLKQNTVLCSLVILLQGLFYPPAVLISALVLLINFFRKRFKKNNLSRLKSFSFIFKKIKANQDYFWGLFTAFIVIIFYGIKTSDFGNTIRVEQAKLLPEFSAEGRSAFFGDSWLEFWLTSRRSGLFSIEWQYFLMCSYGLSIFWLPSLPKLFPLGQKINHKILILGDILLASVGMFILAHLLLFQLHLPGRYTHHTMRIIVALLNGIVLSIIFNSLARKINHDFKSATYLSKTVALIILTCLLLVPTYAVQAYPHRLGYVTGNSPQFYQFLQQQPQDSVIASLSQEADFIPSFTGRSVLVAEEYAIPYHQGYYQKFRQRVETLITAQYSLEKTTLANFIRQYKINFWLLDSNAFEVAYLKNNPWLMQFQPATQAAIKTLQKQQQPLLLKQRDRCSVFQQQHLTLVSTECLMQLN